MMLTTAVIDDNRDAAIGDGADDPIGAFYTSHPYPPPLANLERQRQDSQRPNRRRAEFHLLWPTSEYREDLEILVAGCGTFQAAKHAICWPQARVSAIDISATSLEHTNELKRKYTLTNLDARQLPIERVHELEETFDLIVCTGVLHHLADPDAGLRALRSVLRPAGVMHLMVYAPYGRTGVYMLQEYCRRLGIGTSASDIEQLAGALKSLPRHHPLSALVAQSKDFAQADALADTLLNPRDRAYPVPQLFEFIEGAGLEFRRWFRQAPYLPQCGAMAVSPHHARLTALAAPEQYQRSNCGEVRWLDTVQSLGSSRRKSARFNLTATAGGALCRSGCRTPSASRSGCPREPRPCSSTRVIPTLISCCPSTCSRNVCSMPSMANAR